jgi:lauroyl/myristoyl acyltransferase
MSAAGVLQSVRTLPARLLVDGVYFGAIRALPWLAPALGRGVACGMRVAAPALRRTLVENARLALGSEASEAEVNEVAFRMLAAMQRSISEVLLSQRFSAAELAGRVTRFSGQQGYQEARRAGRGMVIVSAHMGAFEPALAMLRKFESRVHVLFHRDPMPSFERARRRLRETLGVVEHPVAEGVQAWAGLQDALRADEVVVLHGDRTLPFQRGNRIPFLGATDTMLPTGPVRLALACGAPIVPTFCHRLDDGLEVEMTEPIVCAAASLRADEVAAHPAQLALVSAMERAIRRHPDQWLAFAPLRDRRGEGTLR